jgi:predicted nucleic acid-binding protein
MASHREFRVKEDPDDDKFIDCAVACDIITKAGGYYG